MAKTSAPSPSPARAAKAALRGKELAVGAFGSEHAAEAVEKLLQPLAQLMIGHNVQLGAITDMLKKALVHAALHHYSIAERNMTDSRIAILTGVHRKDVRRLRDEPAHQAEDEAYAPLMSVGAQVVARWISEPAYLTTHNKARTLARTPRQAKPGEPDFATLVSEISRDVGAGAIFDELLRLGIICVVDASHVQLQQNAFVPQEGLRETFHFLASNVSDHLATAVHNLRPDRDSNAMLEQSAFSQNLSDDDANELEQIARLLWANTLQQFLQKATVAEQRSIKKTGSKKRVRYGVYFHKAEMSAESAEAPAPAAASKKARP